MTDRSDEVEGVQAPPRSGDVTGRVAVVAKLRPDSRGRSVLAARRFAISAERVRFPPSASSMPLVALWGGRPACTRERRFDSDGGR